MSKLDENSRLSDQFAFSSYDSLEGVPVLAPGEASGPVGTRLLVAVRRLSPGLSIAVLVALSASWLADHYGAPVMLFALLLGMAVNFVGQDVRCRPGIDFASRQILRIGVALLGARITLDQVQALGGQTLLIAAGGVVVTILAGWGLARVLRLKADFGVLTGGSVAICGASAALALSSVLPPSPTRERDTLLTVVGVTTLSTVAMVVYPLIAGAVGLSDSQAGVFLGATIHDVAQVVGAGYGVSKVAGDTATIVKLFRVALLLPTILIVAFIFHNRGAATPGVKRPPLVPMFLVGFAALVAVNSTGLTPPALMEAAGSTSRWFLITAIAAVGAKTSLGELAHVGWKPVLLIVLETVVVLAWVLALLALG
ncbi:YeiH family protein [Phenylobacterium sp.]|uniref:YeiH family protein n=1 Tax=Phenylobacterium sp. TaxID=1871053 RepID=UPI0027324653|nr:putative sulfate exporter family transporter [Phenylobacterium sp.]MDP3853734.1 putative sulfate exporter family transporter [Phenylobacterium sp.]